MAEFQLPKTLGDILNFHRSKRAETSSIVETSTVETETEAQAITKLPPAEALYKSPDELEYQKVWDQLEAERIPRGTISWAKALHDKF